MSDKKEIETCKGCGAGDEDMELVQQLCPDCIKKDDERIHHNPNYGFQPESEKDNFESTNVKVASYAEAILKEAGFFQTMGNKLSGRDFETATNYTNEIGGNITSLQNGKQIAIDHINQFKEDGRHDASDEQLYVDHVGNFINQADNAITSSQDLYRAHNKLRRKERFLMHGSRAGLAGATLLAGKGIVDMLKGPSLSKHASIEVRKPSSSETLYKQAGFGTGLIGGMVGGSIAGNAIGKGVANVVKRKTTDTKEMEKEIRFLTGSNTRKRIRLDRAMPQEYEVMKKVRGEMDKLPSEELSNMTVQDVEDFAQNVLNNSIKLHKFASVKSTLVGAGVGAGLLAVPSGVQSYKERAARNKNEGNVTSNILRLKQNTNKEIQGKMDSLRDGTWKPKASEVVTDTTGDYHPLVFSRYEENAVSGYEGQYGKLTDQYLKRNGVDPKQMKWGEYNKVVKAIGEKTEHGKWTGDFEDKSLDDLLEKKAKDKDTDYKPQLSSEDPIYGKIFDEYNKYVDRNDISLDNAYDSLLKGQDFAQRHPSYKGALKEQRIGDRIKAVQKQKKIDDLTSIGTGLVSGASTGGLGLGRKGGAIVGLAVGGTHHLMSNASRKKRWDSINKDQKEYGGSTRQVHSDIKKLYANKLEDQELNYRPMVRNNPYKHIDPEKTASEKLAMATKTKIGLGLGTAALGVGTALGVRKFNALDPSAQMKAQAGAVGLGKGLWEGAKSGNAVMGTAVGLHGSAKSLAEQKKRRGFGEYNDIRGRS